jgi:ribose 5-phosphate isomerase A
MTAIEIDPKRIAAEYAAQFVQSRMIVGLGAGSTALHAINVLARKLRDGELTDILGIACSSQVERDAIAAGIPLTSLNAHPVIDITIDGADEVDTRYDLIKGGGGAMLREKIVAQASKREVIVVDVSKLSTRLGARWAVPVEVFDFSLRPTADFIKSLGASHVTVRERDGIDVRTDEGNRILDCAFGLISEPAQLAAQLDAHQGVAAHGLFVGLVHDLIVADGETANHIVVRSHAAAMLADVDETA